MARTARGVESIVRGWMGWMGGIDIRHFKKKEMALTVNKLKMNICIVSGPMGLTFGLSDRHDFVWIYSGYQFCPPTIWCQIFHNIEPVCPNKPSKSESKSLVLVESCWYTCILGPKPCPTVKRVKRGHAIT